MTFLTISLRLRTHQGKMALFTKSEVESYDSDLINYIEAVGALAVSSSELSSFAPSIVDYTPAVEADETRLTSFEEIHEVGPPQNESTRIETSDDGQDIPSIITELSNISFSSLGSYSQISDPNVSVYYGK